MLRRWCGSGVVCCCATALQAFTHSTLSCLLPVIGSPPAGVPGPGHRRRHRGCSPAQTAMPGPAHGEQPAALHLQDDAARCLFLPGMLAQRCTCCCLQQVRSAFRTGATSRDTSRLTGTHLPCAWCVCASLVAQLQGENARLEGLVCDGQENGLLQQTAANNLQMSVCWARTVCCVACCGCNAHGPVCVCTCVCALTAAHSRLLSFCRGCVLPCALQEQLERERSSAATTIKGLQLLLLLQALDQALFLKQKVSAGWLPGQVFVFTVFCLAGCLSLKMLPAATGCKQTAEGLCAGCGAWVGSHTVAGSCCLLLCSSTSPGQTRLTWLTHC